MKMTKLIALFGILAFALSACGPADSDASGSHSTTPPTPQINKVTYNPDPLVRDMEMAHNKAKFLNSPAVSFDLDLWFGGRQAVLGTVSMTGNTGKLRLDREEGLTMIYDGDSAYLTPDTAQHPGARFDIFTWSYFFALPYKLNDPGVIWTDTPYKELEGKTFDSKKLSFEDGTGDSSLDWYITYADPKSHIMEYAAYIVTMRATQEEAEVDPHAIGYSDYQDFDGIPIATKWTFFAWRKEGGLTDTLGHAQLSNIQFLESEGDLFERPEKYQLVTYERPEDLE